MQEFNDIPLDWFQQIYIKNGKFIRFTNGMNMKLSQWLFANEPDEVFRAFMYCVHTLKRVDGDLIKSITVELDFRNDECKLISRRSNVFYRSVNRLVELGILYKIKPKVYIVSMNCACVMSDSQRNYFHSHVYSRLNGD